ncbi:MAG: hypothetical protein DMG17_27870 [Acidobacteria bacterium]|nr:MAG: hypothetical protein DMG17_27870 [Acidobacteriota bacterium]
MNSEQWQFRGIVHCSLFNVQLSFFAVEVFLWDTDTKMAMKFLIFSLLLTATLAAAQAKQTFTGTITDSMCPTGDHSRMRMGSNDAECTLACISAHGAMFILYDGKEAYTLSDQQTPESFAGKKVTVTGTLDAKTKTIRVDSITAAK